MTFHSQIAGALVLPARFIALSYSPPLQFSSIAEKGTQFIDREVISTQELISNIKLSGARPFSNRVADVARYVATFADSLRLEGKSVTFVLLTGGLPSDDFGNETEAEKHRFIQALNKLEGFPVHLIIRICTDEQAVVDFYNGIDNNLLSIDVLDDYYSEALEVFLRNPWLNYGMVLHRYREMAYNPILDAIDERKLEVEEVWQLCSLLFNTALPDPSLNWKSFLHEVSAAMKKENQQWSPIKKKFTPWLDLHMLDVTYTTKETKPVRLFQQRSVTIADLKTKILTQWALQPPAFQSLKLINELLETVACTFPPAFGIEEHSYFLKWIVISPAALRSGEKEPIKRAVRKMKFFLHPDKLPKDLSEQQTFLCKMLWDIVADAWALVED